MLKDAMLLTAKSAAISLSKQPQQFLCSVVVFKLKRHAATCREFSWHKIERQARQFRCAAAFYGLLLKDRRYPGRLAHLRSIQRCAASQPSNISEP
jgi:hypothetical protein